MMKAIVLSAGQGSRLLPLTADRPKCTLEVGGRPVLEWQLHALADNGVNEIVVVTGFRAAQVESVVERFRRVRVRTLFNPFYAVSDNLATCWLAREEMTPPFLIVNGDTLFESATLHTLLTGRGDHDITLACDRKSAYDEDDMKVVIESGRLLRVGKKLDLAQVNGESIGMMAFGERGASRFRDRLEQIMRRDEGKARWYLSAIDELAQEGGVGVCSIHGHGWCEVDDRADLAHADTVVRGWNRTEANPLSAPTLDRNAA
ncbi:MAG TPA: nucleotidyltransferase [Xanthomonadales bacterium]|nr:nucleotidyltransferase [Xanthomonadales bacterium]